VDRILGSYPFLEKVPDDFIATLLEVLTNYPADVVEHLADPNVGIAKKCKFIPTIAEINEAAEQYRNRWGPRERPPAYRVLNDEPPEPDPRRLQGDDRKAYVKSLLGYDPSDPRPTACFDPPQDVDISDLPEGHGRFTPKLEAKRFADEEAPWRDRENLRKSSERLAKLTREFDRT
jgi:hypothetical protein